MSETEALRALMDADRWIDRVSSQRSHLPEIGELADVESELRSLMKALQEAQAVQAPVRTAYEDSAVETERLRKRVSDLERTLGASTANARELTALHTELDHVRELLGRAEDRELDLLIEVEPLDEMVQTIRSRAQPLVVRRSDLQRVIIELQASLDEELTALREARRERAAAVSAEVLARYDAALMRAGAAGAAQVDAGRCDGCRIALSPLDLDRWKAQAPESFMPCPECGRLLLP
ncbi:MAG TPA: C4-type zinc ribbon domain-containing protein [Acidimicrobiales bacterium]|nr:C4-type zinc ribbon domain-containing protein [Acidimicrobiales bacterium]HUX03703.1 C4-type zinc ribbon domain-containing protein [Acidimicrobiales bacterium]